MKVCSYIKNHKTERIIAGFAVFAGAGLLTSYGLLLVINTVTSLVSGTSMLSALPFTNTIADFFLAAFYFLASAILFLAGFSLVEAYYGGAVLAGIFGVCLLVASILGTVNSPLGFTSAILCIIGTSLGLLEQRKSPATKTLASVVVEKMAKNSLRILALIAVTSLIFVIAVIVYRGSSYISWSFLTNGLPLGGFQEVDLILEGSKSGVFGIGPALLGSLLVCGTCELICIPLGLGSAIFLAEYAPESAFTRVIHFFVELLSGVPSIILGKFGYTFFTFEFGWSQRSLLGGAICLVFMTLPWNIRVAEEAIKAVSEDFRAASYALGASKLQTIRRVVLESATPGIMTGMLLGFGAAFGEAAVAIFAAGDPQAPFPSTTNIWMFLTGYQMPTLPAWIYGAFRSLDNKTAFWTQEQNVAFAAALVLVAIFLAVTITALLVRNHLNKKLIAT